MNGSDVLKNQPTMFPQDAFLTLRRRGVQKIRQSVNPIRSDPIRGFQSDPKANGLVADWILCNPLATDRWRISLSIRGFNPIRSVVIKYK